MCWVRLEVGRPHGAARLEEPPRGGQGDQVLLPLSGRSAVLQQRAALQNLIKEDADTEEVERMRTLLRHEGFQSHKLLPDRWYFREASTQATTNYQILTDDGEIFDSFLAARDFK